MPNTTNHCSTGSARPPLISRNAIAGKLEHPQVHWHYTPTHASWLNQVEIWFSILTRQALRGVSFTSPRQVREAIDRFLAAYNAQAAPFEWRKRVVHSVGLKQYYADLRH